VKALNGVRANKVLPSKIYRPSSDRRNCIGMDGRYNFGTGKAGATVVMTTNAHGNLKERNYNTLLGNEQSAFCLTAWSTGHHGLSAVKYVECDGARSRLK